jgi:hypothetical protein
VAGHDTPQCAFPGSQFVDDSKFGRLPIDPYQVFFARAFYLSVEFEIEQTAPMLRIERFTLLSFVRHWQECPTSAPMEQFESIF